MLANLSHGNKHLAAAAMLAAALGFALAGPAQPARAATSDEPAVAIREAVAAHFNIPPDLLQGGKVLITVHMNLDRTGAIVGSPAVAATGGTEAARKGFSAAALRAVVVASPFTMLPKDKYESWKEVVLRFEPGDPTP
ncbi:hypothetical protein [Rhizobiales bacterium]|jgi:hypothetical protein|uniref:hypothetical protein n=1 Tax=unclassified Rhizobium TaxID=2613769 RepID=UPI000DDCCA2C